ncbi:Uncharacterized protein dnm_058270 [Desulfonema magnum]|uniref:Uncharacterized protein n=1 Tax=Desulfonema magnum TaxID=45655 RepID=A0A975BRJ8_9BACT|nr:Uncharacterized protein dnm_058270 [Desulfonema magnum]
MYRTKKDEQQRNPAFSEGGKVSRLGKKPGFLTHRNFLSCTQVFVSDSREEIVLLPYLVNFYASVSKLNHRVNELKTKP